MTEKVMITKEQDDAIEEYMNKHKCSKETILDLHAANYKNNLTGGSMQWSDPFRSMNELSVSDMARALYIGYEVEPKYCVGKWVVVTDGFEEIGRISKITKVSGRSVLLEGVNNCWWEFSQIRYATEQEIAAEKGRRSEVKLSEILHDLTIKEKQRLRQILNS